MFADLKLKMVCIVVMLAILASGQCSSFPVFAVPLSVCDTTEAGILSVCNAVSALRYCSNITANGVERDGETFAMELDSNGTADESAQLMVMSSQVIRAVREFLSRIIAGAIAEVTHNFGWSRITILADIADTYFLHSAEEFYREHLATSSSDTSHPELSDSNLLQLRDSDSNVEEFLNEVGRLNLKIIILSLRPHLASKLLCRAHERHLVWPEYAWIVHSVEMSEKTCGSNFTLDGVISLRLKDTYQPMKCCCSSVVPLHPLSITYLDSCSTSSSSQPRVVVQQIGMESETHIIKSHPYPSDLPPQFLSTVYIAIFYTGTTVCFILCTIMLVLYIYFRNDSAIKATSVSLSILIFVGCYLILLHLYILNSNRLPSWYKQSVELRNCACTSYTILNALGFPMALILSTLLVKLIRVCRIFRLKGRASKLTTSNLALAAFALIITIPNVLVSLAWSIGDPYTSVVNFSIKDGLVHISTRCISAYASLWTILLLVYIVILSLVLVIFAILSRNIKYHDFKDTKKISILSFVLVFTCIVGWFSWFFLHVIGADVNLGTASLNIATWSVVLECLGFIFAPKLFPVAKEKLFHRCTKVSNVPAPRTMNTDLN
jgi:hypothetical protein